MSHQTLFSLIIHYTELLPHPARPADRLITEGLGKPIVAEIKTKS